MKKRIISMLLACMMIFSLLPMSVFATEGGAEKAAPVSAPVEKTYIDEIMPLTPDERTAENEAVFDDQDEDELNTSEVPEKETDEVIVTPPLMKSGALKSSPSDVAQIGDQTYATLAVAYNAAEDNAEIKLLGNVTLTAQLVLDKNLTIDLNGNNLNGDAINYAIEISEGKTVTFKDSASTGSATQNYQSTSANLFDVYGTLNIESGTYSSNGSYGVYYTYSGGVLNITGGTSKQTTEAQTKIVGGSYGTKNITGGYFNRNTVPVADGYKLAEETVSEETLYKPVLLTAEEATASITSDSTTLYFETLTKAHSAAKSGDQIVLLKDSADSFTLKDGVTIAVGSTTYTGTLTAFDNVHYVKLESGIYSNVLRDANDGVSVAYVTKGDSSTTYYYDTLAHAHSAATSGDQIVLIRDCSENVTLKAFVTLNENGTNYTGTVSKTSSKAFSSVQKTNGIWENVPVSAEGAEASVAVGDTTYFYAKLKEAVSEFYNYDVTIKLLKDVEITSADVTSNYDTWIKVYVPSMFNVFYATLDGSYVEGDVIKSHSITYTGSKDAVAFRRMDGKLSHVTFKGMNDAISFISGYSYVPVYEYVDVYGEMEVTGNNGAYVIYAGMGQTFDHCTNYAKMTGTGFATDYNAVFVGYVICDRDSTFTFTNCVNQGVLSCGKAAMFVGNPAVNYMFSMNVTNCSNGDHGIIQSTYVDNSYNMNYYMAVDSNTPKIKLNGTEINAKTANFPNIESDTGNGVTNSGYIKNGPIATGMEMHRFDDGTFKIVPATDGQILVIADQTNHTVAYYEFGLGLYTGVDGGGSSRYFAIERVGAGEIGAYYKSTLKDYKFVDSTFVNGGETSTLAGNKIFTKDNETYYVIPNGYHTNGSHTPEAAEYYYVSAYDADGNLLGSVTSLGATTLQVPVAKIGTNEYTSLDEALTAATENANTITLLADVTLGSATTDPQSLTKSITLVLDGHTLTIDDNKYDRWYIVNGATLTVDGTAEGSKVIGTLYVGDNGKTGNLVINGGTYEGPHHDTYNLVAVQTNGSGLNCSVTATNATFIGNNAHDQAIFLSGNKTFSFTNCTITDGVEIRAGNLVLNDCNVTAKTSGFAIEANGNGSATSSGGAAVVVAQHNTDQDLSVTINGGTYSGQYAIYEEDVQNETGKEKISLDVKGGNFTGVIYSENASKFISSGLYSSRPDVAYIAAKKVVKLNPDEATKEAYPFLVGAPDTTNKNEVNVNVIENEVKDNALPTGATSEQTTAANEAKTAITNATTNSADLNVTGVGVDKASVEVAQANEISGAAESYQNENNETINTPLVTAVDNTPQATATQASDVAIVVQTYSDVAVVNVTMQTQAETTDKIETITYDIQPMTQKVATSTTIAESAKSDATVIKTSGNGQNAVKVGKPEKLVVTETTNVTIPLPANFGKITENTFAQYTGGETVYVKHVKENGETYYYTGKITNAGTDYSVSFVNPHGYSKFTVIGDTLPENIQIYVAKIDNTMYTDLSEAISAATADQTIVLLKDYSATSAPTNFGHKQINLDLNGFKFVGSTEYAENVTIANSGTKQDTLAATGTYANDVSTFVADGYDAKAGTDSTVKNIVISSTAAGVFSVVVEATGTDRDTNNGEGILDVYADDIVTVEVKVNGSRYAAADITLTYDKDHWKLNDAPADRWKYDGDAGTLQFYTANQENAYFADGEVIGTFKFKALAAGEAKTYDETNNEFAFTVGANNTYVAGSWSEGWSGTPANKVTSITNDSANIVLNNMSATVAAATTQPYTGQEQPLTGAVTAKNTLSGDAIQVKTDTNPNGYSVTYAVLTKAEVEGTLYTGETGTTESTDKPGYVAGKEPKVPADTNYTPTAPARADAGDYVVFYKVSAPGYVTVSDRVEVSIAKASAILTWSANDFTTEGIPAGANYDYTATYNNGVAFSYPQATSGSSNATVTMTYPVPVSPATSVSFSAVGLYTFTASLGDNYEITNPTKVFRIDGAQIEGYDLTQSPDAPDATNTIWYDGQNHAVAALTIGTPNDTAVKYELSKDGGATWETAEYTEMPTVNEVGVYKVKATLSKEGYYDKVLEKTFTVKSVEYKAERTDYVAGWDLVLVYTNDAVPGFTYDGKMMYDMSSLKVNNEPYKYQNTTKYDHVYGIVIKGDADTTKVLPSNDTAKGIKTDNTCNRYDVNNSNTVDINDYVGIQAVYNVRSDYLNDEMMALVLKADVDGNKMVDTSDCNLAKINPYHGTSN